MNISRVAFVLHPGKAASNAIRDELIELLSERGIEVTDERPDLVVSLGGDGTLLRAAQTAHACNALIVGVNFGSLGFLTEVEAGHERAALEAILDGAFSVEERMMLKCEVAGSGDKTERHVGLNEVLVERTDRHRLVRLDVRVSGERLATFNADGVIVASPTGSTAYALSAGGPIISPRAKALVVVPVSPHMIFSRAVVLAPDDSVEIEVAGSVVVASLSLDGAPGHHLTPGCVIEVARHPRPLRLVRLSGPGFLERLRNKLGPG